MLLYEVVWLYLYIKPHSEKLHVKEYRTPSPGCKMAAFTKALILARGCRKFRQN
jgi:hypothetical protein